MTRKRQPRMMIPEGEQGVPVSKAIGMPELEDGGKLHPLQRPGRSGILPEEDPKLPRIEDYSGEADLPTDGLIVSPAWMAEAVLDGRKTLIVKTRPFEIAGKRYLLISERKALGVVTLGKMRDVDLDELKRTADQHLITEDLRSEWAKAQKGWKKGPFYAWPVAVEAKFDEPAETNIGPGPQVLARDVELKSVEKQIRTDPSHIFFCARLPDEIRKKLTEISGEILKGIDSAEADDADHITVLYIPGKGEYTESDKENAYSAIQKVLDSAKPIDAKFQGWGYFDGASKGGEVATALVALVDAPGLAELHTEIKAAMSKAGFSEVDDQTHGFVPHTTLAYLPVGARIENLPVLDAAFKIEKIELVHSDINELDLRGAAKRNEGAAKTRDLKTHKRVELVPDLDVGGMTTAELNEAHWRLHTLFRGPTENRRRAGFSVEDVSNLHALVVDELFERKVPHPPPPGDGLDDVSEDFERHEEKQPDYDVPPWEKVSKRDYAPINASGVERGREITLDEVLPHFKTFKTKKPYIYLVGGLANRGKTKGDIDILVKDTEDLPEDFKHVVHFRLGRMLPPEMSERLEIHYDNFHGPFTRFVELFDLTFERVNPENEVKLMRDETAEKQEARAASPELRAQAERAEKNDKLTLGEFFYQPKPTRPAFPEELQTIERFLSLYRERADEWLPTVVQKKFDGARHQVHKDGDKVRIFSEDGEDNTARLPKTVEEIKKLKTDKLVFDCEIELWKGRQHLPREVIAGYLHAKDEPDDSDVVTNMFDVLYHGKEGDIHKEPVSSRLELLGKLGIEQSTMGAPDLKHRLNAAPGDVADDPEELEKAVRRIRELPGSEGVVCKQVDSLYPLKVVTPDTWVKFHNASTVRGIVLGREKTKGGVWVYQYGVLPGRAKPIKTVQIAGKTVVPVGDTFATKLDFSEGDPILIEGETINIERSPKGERMSVWVPRVIGPWTDKADTTDSAAARARRNLVLQVKVIDEEGNIEYLPMRAVEKQADPYLEIPNEDRAPYDYTVQEHFRGKSLHADLRIGFQPGKLLLGWTMNTQIAGAIKEPVTTLKQAQQLAKTRMNEYSKINWRTGEWAERPKRGTTKLVRTSILSERKAPEPWAWMDVEGKTQDPEPGKAPPVGGTRKYPGVFNIVDKGEVEFGSQKPWFHEYFFTKGELKGRLIFRQLRIQPAKKGTYSRKQCMHTECKRAPDVDVLWADGRSRVWFCTEHLAEWKQQFKDRGEEDWLEIVGEKKVTSGEVPEKWSAVHKSDDVIVSKEVVLPPSEEQGLPGPAWLAIKPDDLTPYVLGSDAVKKDWMPPVGVSALPKAIRAQVPAEYHYWKKKTAASAKQARDALFLAIKAKEVKLDYAAPYGRTTTKASMLDARFVLQEQTWRGPIQIRVGPSRTLWHLRLDVGRPELIVAEMYLNPLDNKRLAADVKDDPHKDSMKLQGAIKPSHYLNPTKATPSNIEILDSGKASVLAYSDKFLKVQLKGELLKGLYEAKRSDGDWLWQPSEPGPTVEKEAGDEYRAEFVTEVPIVKVDKEKRLVTGVVLEPNTVDAQGDTIDAEAIERAAHKFLAQYNRETQLGVLHTIFGENGIELVESWVAKTDFKLGGENVSKGIWLMTNKIIDDALWKKVKAGEITGFSIGGVATVI